MKLSFVLKELLSNIADQVPELPLDAECCNY